MPFCVACGNRVEVGSNFCGNCGTRIDWNNYVTDGLLNNYVIFDLETTGTSIYYSEIVQISALKVRNGEIIESFDALVKPKKNIPQEVTEINHITNSMVLSAEDFKTVFPKFQRFINGAVLVGYNIAGFDIPLLNTRLHYTFGDRFTATYVDILPLARKMVNLPNFKLSTLANYFDIDTSNAHNALADCKITFGCLKGLERIGCSFEPREYVGKELCFRTMPSANSIAINVLRAVLADVAGDGVVSTQEFYELQTWITENRELQGSYPYDDIKHELDNILEDGIIEPQELEHLEMMIEEWLDPINHSKHSDIVDIVGKHIVITGDFALGSKQKVIEILEKNGAVVDNNVVKKTNYVVVGALGSSAWSAGNYGNKVKKAMEYKDQGQAIEIIPENEFWKEIGI